MEDREFSKVVGKLRKEDAYCRISYADLIRVLIERGLKASEEAAV